MGDVMTRALSMREFAERMGLSYFTVSRKVKRGEIPAHRIGGAIRILWDEVLQNSRIKPAWEKGRYAR